MPDAGLSITGIVRNPDGEPIRGAWVVFGDIHWYLETQTDETGRYRLEELETDSERLAVAAAGYEPSVVSVEIPEDGVGVMDVMLQPGGKELAGRVVDESGEALAGIEVRWYPGDHSDLSLNFRTTRTDDRGRFRFRGVPAGRHSVHARDPFRSFERPRNVDAGAMDLEFRFRPAGVLAGHVDLPESLPPPGPEASFGAVVVKSASGRELEPSLSLRDAEFRREHVVPGDYDIQARVTGAGCSPVERVTVRSGEETFVTLVPTQGSGRSGRVVAAEDSTPLDGARVVAIEMTMPVNALYSSRPERIQAAGGVTTLSGEDGVFRLSGLSETAHFVAVHRAGRIPMMREAAAATEADEPEFALHRAGSLRVETEGPDRSGALRLRYPSGDIRHRFGPAEEPILFDDLPTGVYEVAIGSGQIHYRARPLVREGKTRRLRLAPPADDARLTGRVDFPEGVVRSTFLMAWWEEGGVTYARRGRLAGDGAFEITGLPDHAVELAPDFGQDPVWPGRHPGVRVVPGDDPVTLPIEAVELRFVSAVTGEPLGPQMSDKNRVVLPIAHTVPDEVTYRLFGHHPVRLLSPSTTEPNEVRVRPAEQAWIGVLGPDDRYLHGAEVQIEDVDGWDLTDVARVFSDRPPFVNPPSFRLAPGEYMVTVTHPDHDSIESLLRMEERPFSGYLRMGLS